MNLRNQIIRYLRKIKLKIDNEYKEVFPYQFYGEEYKKNDQFNEIDSHKNKVLNTRENLISELNTYTDNILFLRDNLSTHYCLNEYNKFFDEIAIQRFFFEASLIEINNNDLNHFNKLTHSIYFRRINSIDEFFPGLLFILLRQEILNADNKTDNNEKKSLIKKISSQDLISNNFYLESVIISFTLNNKDLRKNLFSKIHCSESENNLKINSNFIYNKLHNKDDIFFRKFITLIEEIEKEKGYEYFVDLINETISNKFLFKICFIFLEYLYFYAPSIFIKVINKIDCNFLVDNLIKLEFFHLFKQIIRLSNKNLDLDSRNFISNNNSYYQYNSKEVGNDMNYLSSLQINERLKGINKKILVEKDSRHKASLYIFGQVRSNKTLNYLINSFMQFNNISDVNLISWSKVNPRSPNNFAEINSCHSDLSAKEFELLLQSHNLNMNSKTCFEKNIIPKFLKLDSDLNLDNKNVKISLEREENIFLNNPELNNIGCPNHIKNQLKFIYLFKKCLDDISLNDKKAEVYFFTRPDFYPKYGFQKFFDNMLNQLILDNQTIVCDSEQNCLTVKLGGIGDRFFGIHSSRISLIKEKIEEYLKELLDIFFKKENNFDKNLMKLNYDIFGAHHFIEYILFSVGLKEKHYFDIPFKLKRKIYTQTELEEIMQLSSKIN